jgi:DNA-binding NtrC family response regulator
VDEDAGIRELMVTALGYCVNREVLSFESSSAAWQCLQDGNAVDLLICNVDRINPDGFDLLTQIKHHWPDTLFIVMSGQAANEKKAELAGADGFLGKPFAINDLFNLVQRFVVD